MNYFHPYLMHSFTVAGNYPMNPGFAAAFFTIIGILAVWELVWKGFALWYAARNHQKAWFVIILIINSAGIIPIVYLLFFRKNKNNLVHTTTVTETHTTTASTPTPAAPSTPSADMSSSTPTAQ